MESKFVYMFSEGDISMRNLLGGKGATLADMTNLGLPIPQGFIVTTESCAQYYNEGQKLSSDIEQQIEAGMKNLEAIAGKKFGDTHDPLLVSVRSGARVSMPGMMDTILNLGLNDMSVKGLAESTGNPKFAYDSYRRFIQMFSDVVMEIDRGIFEDLLERMRERRGYVLDSDIQEDDLKTLVEQYKTIYEEKIGEEFPQDPKVQLLESIKAVFRSWMNPRAQVYRRMQGFSSAWGTAVNVQIMVFGNKGATSGSGVAFSRSPVDGTREIFGEYLMDAQGEDVVAGIRNPLAIEHLANNMPEVYKQFETIAYDLEKHYNDMQDMEFTIENKKLYILQSRSGKRTAQAAVKIAVDMVAEGLIDKEQAILQIQPGQLNQLLHPQFDEDALDVAVAIGSALPASPGAASGRIYFTSDSALQAHLAGERVILVRQETSPEDIEGMAISQGILTARGGMTSHAAVVARGMGICCISGCDDIHFIDETSFKLGLQIYEEGDTISLDGSRGIIYDGFIETVEPELSGEFQTIIEWADAVATMEVRANADSPKDALKALSFGAKGLGLCRTEHMFFQPDRIMAMRQMIVAQDEEERQVALDLLLPMQRGDFIEMFTVMEDLPITIRLLDPPLHEFLPQQEKDLQHLAQAVNRKLSEIKSIVASLHEFNPMMGHRGGRLAITYPEIARMQTRAIIEAAIHVQRKENFIIKPEIMIPLIGDVKEFEYIKDIVVFEAEAIIAESDLEIAYTIGTMIEIPRAALQAEKIAEQSDFFSFGTNDLTQLTYGFSRDDAGGFLDAYYDKGIFVSDPFASIDQVGVGELMRIAVDRAHLSKPDLKMGICGEHGGDPASVEFCYGLGLDYVSCSPFRIPIAKVASAQAVLKGRK